MVVEGRERIVKSGIDGKVKEWEGTSMPVGVMGGAPPSCPASWTTVLTQFFTISKVFFVGFGVGDEICLEKLVENLVHLIWAVHVPRPDLMSDVAPVSVNQHQPEDHGPISRTWVLQPEQPRP